MWSIDAAVGVSEEPQYQQIQPNLRDSANTTFLCALLPFWMACLLGPPR